MGIYRIGETSVNEFRLKNNFQPCNFFAIAKRLIIMNIPILSLNFLPSEPTLVYHSQLPQFLGCLNLKTTLFSLSLFIREKFIIAPTIHHTPSPSPFVPQFFADSKNPALRVFLAASTDD